MILAIDLGSTSFKAGVFDADMTQRSEGTHELCTQFAPGGKVEIPVPESIEAFGQAVRQAVADAHIEPGELRAIAVTSQAQTFTVVDAAGTAKIPFISWQDGRALDACNALKADGRLADFAQHCSFGELLHLLQICQIRNLQDTQADLIGSAGILLHLPTFLVRLCTGVEVIDDNLAAMCGLYSLPEAGWWEPALRACKLHVQQLAKVVPVGSVAAQTDARAEQFGLPAGIPIVLAGNDQTAGGYGARLDEHNAVLITLGTAQVAYACVDELPAPSPALVRGPYPGGKYYRMAADSVGGSVLNWAKTVLSGCESDETFFSQAAAAPSGSRGLVFDAELAGSAGTWKNIGLHHTPSDLARSVVEGLSRRLADLVEQLGVPVAQTRFLAGGGGSRSPLWLEILGELLGAPLERTDANPLLGAAMMAQSAAPAAL